MIDDRWRCSKTIESYSEFTRFPCNEIDASRFSGPEHFLAGVPRYSPLGSKIDFFNADSIDVDAWIDRDAKNIYYIQKTYAGAYAFQKKTLYFFIPDRKVRK